MEFSHPFLQQEITQSVKAALAEDLGFSDLKEGDITAQLIPASHTINARLITREDCVFVGAPWIKEVFTQLDPTVQIDNLVDDGTQLKANDLVCELSGNARSILTGERTAMNFCQTLSGTATAVSESATLLQGTKTKLLDTRKTIPGMRFGQKYAVSCGGGHNHRIGLYDAFLIKENHIMACGGISNAVLQAKNLHPEKPVEVEVENLDELNQAISAGANIVMLDNFELAAIHEAVKLANGKIKLEVSGNVTKKELNALSATGVDYISSGALTKHIKAIDLSLRVSE